MCRQNRPERIENRGERQGDRDQRRDEVRDQYDQNNPGNFWQENPGWSCLGYYAPLRVGEIGVRWEVGAAIAANQRPTATVKTSIIRTTRSTPATSRSPRRKNMPQQAEEIATAAPSAEPQQGDWLPLGVFAITQDGQASGAEPSLYMQLAISKQGVISGTLKNTLTGKVQTLEGMADKKSQRVAWGVVDQQRPIMETGLSNLTQDASPALIHFADGQTQQWLMVRIPEPKQ